MACHVDSKKDVYRTSHFPTSWYADFMRELLGMQDKQNTGFLDGQFLIAMPSMLDPSFARTVIYLCAHTNEGAMGFVLNRQRDVSFPEILSHLAIDEQQTGDLPLGQHDFPILDGGPVDGGRGFVIHSDDYAGGDTMPLSEDVSLTATQDIIRAIARGKGPRRSAMFLGYSGWRKGQLEDEIAQNAWLTCPADGSLIFDPDLDGKYERAMGLMGICTQHLSAEAGHA